MNKVSVNIKKFNPKAVVPFKTYNSDFCFDCVATSCEEVAPNVYKYGLGFGLQLAEPLDEETADEVNFCFTIRPRSSVWKTGMVLSNSISTIDFGYTGEIFMVFYHVMPNMPRYQVGDKIGQVHLSMTGSLQFNEVNEFSETERGDGGYGSTGK